MDGDWITSPSARRVQQHGSDSRPAWLWSADGETLLWCNPAADLFLAKLKKNGLRRAALAVPIRGQVARNIRLGSPGRTSLARIQFLAGDKPASSTCATTPLVWEDGNLALLIVAVDPIAPEIMDAARQMGAMAEPKPVEVQEPAGAEESLPASEPVFAEVPQVEPVQEPEPHKLPPLVEPSLEQLAAPQEHGDELISSVDETEAVTPADESYQRELENWRDAEGDSAQPEEAVEPSGPADMPADEGDEEPQAQPTETSEPQPGTSRLSRLVDQLASDGALYTPLTDADDNFEGATALPDLTSTDAAITEAEADLEDVAALDGDGAVDTEAAPEPDASEPEAAEDVEAVERVSRYNFDELSRILNDRVGELSPPPRAVSEPQRGGALINLGGETLVLNRLPLGILVFRDQQVLFANRAITEMVGYHSVEALREAGLAAVFPAAGPEGQEAGPVNHLVQRDGTLVPVTARLQSISWQGRPALMLSASATEVRTGHEAAVRAFAQTAADLRGDGFFEATRTGVLSAVTPRAANLLNAGGPLEGKALSTLIAPREVPALREFLERPARFAESERPYLSLHAQGGNAEIVLFAQGQAGVVTNYFGFVRGRDAVPARIAAPAEADPALLARISRGVRRPLNTIIGFAELLRSQAFGGQQDKPFEGYAQDIAAAGQDIAALIDELDNYARLRDGRYLPQRASINLTSLLESCVLRIRHQANSARVILRNAISESLPRITADQASLEQAVLNLLASAVDQSPTGGAVVISAKLEEDGSISVHVRDSSSNAVDMAERFVVFRDGVGRDGKALAPVRSSVGLALTRSLLAVNTFSLSVDPAGERGLLFTLIIPADQVEDQTSSGVAE
ncbi:histidine kinase dimerization/phospho-acceptor domain-containing protein [Devosia submarina]|uniref:histidine kinase dimerization/phospho-acceptor domain-containing protein n=1 Tax=Devosia submarina TaxID=1173082 RepID=UPI000D344D95|nr:histidine kinase dimerization/phospho-acceptor domain-containing protein [Devosia submarina]